MTSFIYFVQAGRGGAVKIGMTENVEKRIAMLQTGCPHRLVLLGVEECEDARTREAELHQRFAKLRIRSEWFQWSPELGETIAAVSRRARCERTVTQTPVHKRQAVDMSSDEYGRFVERLREIGPLGHLDRLTEGGNAERFADAYADRFRCVWKNKRSIWYVHGESGWCPDRGARFEAAKILVDHLFKIADEARTALAGMDGRKDNIGAAVNRANDLRRHAHRSSSLRAINGMLWCARSDPRIACTEDEFDRLAGCT